MRKFIYLAMFVVSLAFLYLVAFSSNVEAGGSVAPTPANCYDVCDAGETCPTLDTNGACNCPGYGAPCSGTDGDDTICGTSAYEEIFAGKGDDIVCDGGGGDLVHGGWGCDDLQGEDDTLAATLHGGHCADSHTATEGAVNNCFGGWGDDYFEDCDSGGVEGQTDDHNSQGECSICN